MSIVKFENVTRIYTSGDHELRALDGVNMVLDEGKFVVVLGPSGAGKSTLLNMLGGLDSPTSGKITVNGKDISTLNNNELSFLDMLDKDVSKYETKIILAENTTNEDAITLADKYSGDWQAASGISYEGKTLTLEVYNSGVEQIGFLTENNEPLTLSNDGVYLCLRLKDTANIGDTIEFSPYGSEETYSVKVAGYFRSLVSESIVMTQSYADSAGVEYHIGAVYTDIPSEDIESSALITGKQEKQMIMDSYDTFMDIMNVMIVVLVVAAIVLGIVVLYNLGVMSYVERYRELATLKVLGFRDKAIGKLLITQNIWLTFIGAALGLPGGVGVLYILVKALVSEYELSLALGPATYLISITLTFGVSLLVGFMVSRRNKKIDMVEALKGAE